MKIVFLVLTFVAALVTPSCSEKTDADAKRTVKTENARSSDEITAARSLTNSESRDSSAGTSSDADSQPEAEEIAEDCVSFVRSTLTEPVTREDAECPNCPANTAEVLQFHGVEVEQMSCSGESCEIAVKLRAIFNQSTGAAITGGLVAWIPAEQRASYLRGQTPSGEQTYGVKITYQRDGKKWRPIEFDKAE